MRNGKIRRFRPRSNRHYSRRRSNAGIKSNNGVYQLNSQRNTFSRNSTSKNPHNLEKIIEKYKVGDVIKNAVAKGYSSFGCFFDVNGELDVLCLLYTSPSPRD